MDILKRFILTLLFLVTLTSCYTDFNPDEYSGQVLCLNSVITAGEPITVSVKHSWRYNDSQALLDHDVKDALVSIYVNGELKESDYIAAEGDEIRIIAESKEYGTAEATVVVPTAIPIESVEFFPFGVRVFKSVDEDVEDYMRFNYEIKMRIVDSSLTDDYFRLSYYADSHSNLTPGSIDYNSDQIFKEHIGIMESVMGGYENLQLFFTDRQFAGSHYSLNVKFEDAWFDTSTQEDVLDPFDCGITFELQSLSKSFYDRLNYLWQKNSGGIGELTGLGLANPIWGYSNVSTGAGVVVAKSSTTYTISLKDFIKSALDGTE